MRSYISREFVYRVENKKIINFSFEHFSLFISFNIVKRKLECKNKWKYRIRENFFFFFLHIFHRNKIPIEFLAGKREEREREREEGKWTHLRRNEFKSPIGRRIWLKTGLG